VSSDYIDICYDLMKPYTYMLYLTYLLPCELESHTSRGDYNCTKKNCWLWFPVDFYFFFPLLFAIHCQRIFSRNLTKMRCILIQHFQQHHYPLFNLKINCEKKEKKNWWKEGKFIVHVYTKERLISWSFHVSLCLGTGAPALLLKTLKWGMALRQPFDLVDPFRQSLM